MAHKAPNIYYMALYRKSLPPSDLNERMAVLGLILSLPPDLLERSLSLHRVSLGTFLE